MRGSAATARSTPVNMMSSACGHVDQYTSKLRPELPPTAVRPPSWPPMQSLVRGCDIAVPVASVRVRPMREQARRVAAMMCERNGLYLVLLCGA